MERQVPDTPHATVLERLDLAVAGGIVDRLVGQDNGPEKLVQTSFWRPAAADRPAWIAGLLALRGFRLDDHEVACVLTGAPGRFRPEHQEFKLIRGFAELTDAVVERAAAGQTVDGWWLVEMFRRTTEGVERFRNNTLRRDMPWDALVGVRYPEPGEVQPQLDGFHVGAAFGDDPQVFGSLHPVRQAVRLMWRFARIAPFPDFNLPFAAVAFATHLLASGYPPLLPDAGDRVRLQRLVRGRAPLRALALESRLLDQVVAGAGSRA